MHLPKQELGIFPDIGKADEAAQKSAGYGFVSSVLSAILTISGVGLAEVPESRSMDVKSIRKTNDTFIVTPEFYLKEDGAAWLAIGLLSGGVSHTWHSKDQEYYPRHSIIRYYAKIRSDVPFPGENYRHDYKLFSNNCTTRFNFTIPSQYYSNYNYVGPAIYWKR